ncbi:MAG: class I SAM-dependent methyltransferase [Acidobacteriota bacterium]|nr:class I SAM-dependent methyltransferase [Acidobacteriota bacterium]
MTPYEEEINRNAEVWRSKALLRDVYFQMYARVAAWIDTSIAGKIVEIGSGIGNFGEFQRDVVLTDQSIQPWLDLTCSAYRLPFREGTVSHIVMFDVFHHLSAPRAFFESARPALASGGRIILLEPYISLTSAVVYGVFHDEPIAWRAKIEDTPTTEYYAAQGNATRLLLGDLDWLPGWRVVHREAFSAFGYLLSGGFSRPALYPRALLPTFNAIDRALSHFPRLFGARCLIVLGAR